VGCNFPSSVTANEHSSAIGRWTALLFVALAFDLSSEFTVLHGIELLLVLLLTSGNIPVLVVDDVKSSSSNLFFLLLVVVVVVFDDEVFFSGFAAFLLRVDLLGCSLIITIYLQIKDRNDNMSKSVVKTRGIIVVIMKNDDGMT
jgi:hypothetical protein